MAAKRARSDGSRAKGQTSSAPELGAREEALRQQDLAHEIEVATTWARLLTDAGSLSRPLPARRLREGEGEGACGDEDEAWLVEGLFSAAECASLLAAAEEHGFGITDYEKSYRGNLRLTTVDRGLSEAVWKRLKPLVPATITLTAPKKLGPLHWWEHYGEASGVWDSCGLNECWRLAKYYPGDKFMVHCDQAYERVIGAEMSMFTVNIYMNGGFKGGRTRFYMREDPYFECRSDYGQPDSRVAPEVGLCLLFRQPPGQSYWHDGEELHSGVKYLFRTDVMYRKRSCRPRVPMNNATC